MFSKQDPNAASRTPRKKVVASAAVIAVAMVFLNVSPANAYQLTGCKFPQRIMYVESSGVPSGKWSESLGSAITQVRDRTNATLISRSTGQISTEARLYGNTGWNAQATWWCFLGATSSAKIEMNRSASEMANGTAARVSLTWQHEFGHALGLAHIDNTSRVMYGKGTQTPWNLGIRNLTAGDIRGINALY
ncbi:matrixin family metalloprotease [Leucobacter albus]|uniref:Matrixin family metalloprotease n=1 Tax=Leucobacter albus TaxID=272210 RepID=A0ABW3TMS4_9MICO